MHNPNDTIEDLLQQSILILTRALDLIDDEMQSADHHKRCYLFDQKQSIGSFVEEITTRKEDYNDYLADPELGDQGAINREIAKSDGDVLRETIKSSHEALCGLPFSGHIGE